MYLFENALTVMGLANAHDTDGASVAFRCLETIAAASLDLFTYEDQNTFLMNPRNRMLCALTFDRV